MFTEGHQIFSMETCLIDPIKIFKLREYDIEGEAGNSHLMHIWLCIKYAWANYILFLGSVEEFTMGSESLKGNPFK